jgi:NADPH:quinone reductase-like Zn-dependent oxidoreductase
MFRSTLDLSRIRPLEKSLWAGAVDNLGGDVLAWIASSMKLGGTVASIGMAAGHSLNMTVMPFILRGVSLLGIDSVNVGEPYRSLVWKRLASDLKPRHLPDMAHRVSFDDLPGVFDSFLSGKSLGRVVVELGGEK